MVEAIKLEKLCFAYERSRKKIDFVLRDIDLSFQTGTIVCLAGRTGAGKSTLIQNLDGLLTPLSGKISYSSGIVVDMTPKVKKNGKIIYRKAKKNKRWKELRKSIGIVFQFSEDQLFKNSVLSDIMVGPLNFGASKEDAEKAAREAMKEVGLDPSFESRSPFDLSGGEKRRAAIAGVLAFKPDVLILDEPTVGLDAAGAAQMEDIIRRRRENGGTMILVTHDMDLAYRLADRMIVLKDGKVLLDGAPTEIFKRGDEIHAAGLLPPKAFVYTQYLVHQGYPLDEKKCLTPEGIAAELGRVLG